MDPPEISVVVPARDAEATLPATLAGLAVQEAAGGHEAIVVDNGSRDATAAVAEASPAVDRVLRRERGDGPGAARNDGARAARGRLLAFLDADCVPAPGWLAAGAAALETADLVQGAVHPVPDAQRGPWDRTLWVTAERGLYESANLFVSRELFERLGGFEEAVELDHREAPFGEDAWLGWRARRAGARTAFSPEAEVHHAVFPRGAGGYVAERRRLRHFPALVARIPELRAHFLWHRWFLTPRTAAVSAAAAGALAALATRRALPVLGVAPYAGVLVREARTRGPGVAAVEAAADAVGLAALVRGSVRARRAVL